MVARSAQKQNCTNANCSKLYSLGSAHYCTPKLCTCAICTVGMLNWQYCTCLFPCIFVYMSVARHLLILLIGRSVAVKVRNQSKWLKDSSNFKWFKKIGGINHKYNPCSCAMCTGETWVHYFWAIAMILHTCVLNQRPKRERRHHRHP